jgi:hypothetical protein
VPTEDDYAAAADWAEYDMVLVPNSRTALHGAAAAQYSRALLARAGVDVSGVSGSDVASAT